ncbi:MAG: DNA-protecting protein DprA [Planctomycetes bacterium]|nr:DNA-protecting protein DprA [Planctomycetota bacterium]
MNDSRPPLAPQDATPAALLHCVGIALALPSERELALLRAHAAADPTAPPWRAPGLPALPAERIAAACGDGRAAREAANAAALGLALISWHDPRYPRGLFDLVGPPALLYVRGRGQLPHDPAVTIVGSRASTARGRAFAADLGRSLAQRGAAVVSGLAIGIDQAAHEGALAAGGPCCAVLACGLDRIYPPGAVPLAARLEAHGTLVSEMPIGTPPYKDHFPRRNRLLAAWSCATLVVEADLRSGSLVTAHRALELGRSVHAVPGNIDAPSSRGTNRLIRDGAHPLLEIADLDLLLPGTETRVAAGGAALLDALAAPQAAAAIAERLARPLDHVLIDLVELELEGKVTRLGGGLWSRT